MADTNVTFGLEDDVVSFGLDDEVVQEEATSAPVVSNRDPDMPYADEAMNAKVEADRIAAEQTEEEANAKARMQAIENQALSVPTTDMYEGMSADEARALRQRYEESPSTTQSMLGFDVFTAEDGRKYNIPSPVEGIISGEPYVSIIDKVYGGIGNAGANLMELGAAGVDMLTGGDPTATKWVQQNVPKLKAGEDISDNLLISGSEVAVGMASGAGLVNLLSKAKTVAQTAQAIGPYVTNTVKGVVTMLGAEAGMSSTVDSDSGTLLVGDKAMLPLIEGLNIPEDANEAEAVLRKRGNILADSLLLAGPFKKVADGAAATAGFLKASFVDPVLGVMSQNKREQVLVKSILDRLASVSDASTEEEIAAVQRWIVDTIKSNQELVVKIGQDQKDQIAVQYDTLTALQKGLDPNDPAARVLNVEANNIRQGALAKGSPQLQDATEAPSRALQQTTEAIEGTGEAITPATKGIVREAEQPLREAEEKVLTARAELTEAEKTIPVIMKEDPEMGAKIANLERDTGLDIYTRPDQAVDEIVGGVRQAYEVMSAQKDELYKAVQGGTLEPKVIRDMFGRMDAEQQSQFIRSLPSDSPVRGLLGELDAKTIQAVDAQGKPVMKPVLGKDGKPVVDKDGKPQLEQEVRKETPEEVDARIATFLAENGIDFGYMYREVRPALAMSASDLFASGNTASKQAGRQIRDAVHYIDNDLLDWVARNSDPEAAEAAQAAKDYYVTMYAKYWKDGALGDVATVYDGTVGRTSAGMREQYGMEIQPVNFEQGAIDTVTGIVGDTQRAKANQLIELLGTGEAGVSPSTLTDYIISDALTGIANTVRANGISAVNTGEIAQSLSGYASILQKNYPEEYARLNSFLGRLQEAQNNVALKQELLGTAEQAAKEMQEELHTGVLNGFLKANGVVNPNGYATLSNLFNNPQSMDQLQEIVSIARQSDNPVIMEGIQQAYARNLRAKLLGGTREAAGSRALKLGESTKMLDDATSDLLAKGELIFADKPLVMEGVTSLIGITQGVAINKRGRAFAGASNTAFSQSAQQSIDRVIMAMIGPLTRLGARVRSATGTVISTLSPDEAGAKALDAILANPEEFTRIAEKVLAEPTLTGENVQSIFGFLVRAGIYGENDAMDYINMIGQMEIEAEKAGNAVSQQMQDLGIPQ